ncbi:MAG: hypothetical protein LBH25_10885 [Fibromonadaceae bacterium]|jgi:hypothetical protein|nr:hypothetical protein [Fibromonadaceae bacterium]
MPALKTLSQEILEIVGDDPDSFDETKEQQVKELLKPINDEIPVDTVVWHGRISSW